MNGIDRINIKAGNTSKIKFANSKLILIFAPLTHYENI